LLRTAGALKGRLIFAVSTAGETRPSHAAEAMIDALGFVPRLASSHLRRLADHRTSSPGALVRVIGSGADDDDAEARHETERSIIAQRRRDGRSRRRC